MKYRYKLILAAFMLMLLFSVTGCGKGEDSKRRDIDFTVCDDTKVPNELLEIINEKKAKVFKLTYINSEFLYIAIGYGEHERNNFNVVVEDLYVTDNAIYVDTNLYTSEMTPSDAVAEGGASMYPYVVLKCEKYELPVVFEID